MQRKSLYLRLREPCNESPQKLYNGLRDASQRPGSVSEIEAKTSNPTIKNRKPKKKKTTENRKERSIL